MGKLLFQRPGGMWVVMQQYRDPWLIEQFGKKREISLGTKDKREAQILAAPHVLEHDKRVLMAKQRRLRKAKLVNKGFLYPVGRTVLDDGRTVMADEQMAWIKELDGTMREVRNSLLLVSSLDPDEDVGPPIPEVHAPDMAHFAAMAPKPPKKEDPDRRFVDDWIAERKPTKYVLAEGEKAFALFKSATNGMLFKDAYRPDAMKLVLALQAEGKKNATVNKHLSHMRSIVSLAVLNGHLKHNCFSRLTLDAEEDALERDPFSEDQMKLVRDNLHTFDPEVAKLWVLLATTGMRLSEPWDITEERDELGIRKVRVGTKSRQSDRFIPLPAGFLERYPEKITGPLFTKSAKTLGKDLIAAFRGLGLDSEKLVNHSLRHRAKDRLRAFDCTEEMQFWCLGHEETSVADSYGKGPAMAKLKPWIDRIGY